MKRRIHNKTKRNQANSGSAKFSIARLEPKQLLAGDLSAQPFVGPVLPSPAIEIISVDCSQEESKSKEESNCIVFADGLQLQGVNFSVIADGNTFTSSDYDTSGFSSLRSPYTANELPPTEPNDLVSIVAEDPPPESLPVEKLPLTKRDEVYFKKVPTKEISSALNDDIGADLSARSSRIDMLGHQQLFAIISPSEATPTTFGVLANSTSSTNAIPSVLVQSLRGIDSAFSSLSIQSNFHGRHVEAVTLERRRTGNPIVQQDSSLDFLSDRIRELNAASEKVDSTLPVYETKLLTNERPDFAFPLLQSYDSPVDVEPEILKTKIQPPIKPTEPKDESAKNDKLGRHVQVVGSAIVLIGFPSSQILRENDAADHRPK